MDPSGLSVLAQGELFDPESQSDFLSPEEYDLSELIRGWAGVRNLRKGKAGDEFAQVFPTGGEVGGSREVLGWVK